MARRLTGLPASGTDEPSMAESATDDNGDYSNEEDSATDESVSSSQGSVEENASDNVCLRTQEWNDISASESDASTSDEDTTKIQLNNAGWAKAMNRVLSANKPTGKKSVILSKAEKMSKLLSVKANEEKDSPDFEIVGEVKEEKDVKPDVLKIDVKPKVDLAEKKVRPSVLDRERERRLNKIATKGVVQLFNAVRHQQKVVKRKLNSAEGRVRKEDKVYQSLDKRSFVNMLMGSADISDSAPKVTLQTDKEVKPEETSDWNVLQDSFMTGGNLKDWDKGDKLNEELVEIT